MKKRRTTLAGDVDEVEMKAPVDFMEQNPDIFANIWPTRWFGKPYRSFRRIV